MISPFFVGMTGFEPATTRPPDAYSTGLSYIPQQTTTNPFLFEGTAKVELFFDICNSKTHFSVFFIETNMEKYCCACETYDKSYPYTRCTHTQGEGAYQSYTHAYDDIGEEGYQHGYFDIGDTSQHSCSHGLESVGVLIDSGKYKQLGGDGENFGIGCEQERDVVAKTYHEYSSDSVHQQHQMDTGIACHAYGNEVAFP